MTALAQTTGAMWMGHQKALANLKASTATRAITGWEQFKAELEADLQAAWGQLEGWGEEAYQAVKNAIVQQWGSILPAEVAIIKKLLGDIGKEALNGMTLEEIVTKLLNMATAKELPFLYTSLSHVAQAVIAAILSTL